MMLISTVFGNTCYVKDNCVFIAEKKGGLGANDNVVDGNVHKFNEEANETHLCRNQ